MMTAEYTALVSAKTNADLLASQIYTAGTSYALEKIISSLQATADVLAKLGIPTSAINALIAEAEHQLEVKRRQEQETDLSGIFTPVETLARESWSTWDPQEQAFFKSIDPKQTYRLPSLDPDHPENITVSGQELRNGEAVINAYVHLDKQPEAAKKELNQQLYDDPNGPQREEDIHEGAERLKKCARRRAGLAHMRARTQEEKKEIEETIKEVEKDLDQVAQDDTEEFCKKRGNPHRRRERHDNLSPEERKERLNRRLQRLAGMKDAEGEERGVNGTEQTTEAKQPETARYRYDNVHVSEALGALPKQAYIQPMPSPGQDVPYRG